LEETGRPLYTPWQASALGQSFHIFDVDEESMFSKNIPGAFPPSHRIATVRQDGGMGDLGIFIIGLFEIRVGLVELFRILDEGF